jgi:hypothetical protein
MQTEKEIRETIPVTIPTKTIKYLGINFKKETKELLNKIYKPLKKKNQRRLQKMEGPSMLTDR